MERPADDGTRELITHLRSEAATYQRQWTLSLGVGCGGAAIALISLAANLPDPNYAFRLFAPSLWLFVAGIIASASSLPIAALRSSSMGEHYAASFNRDQYQAATRHTPEFFSYPKRMAETLNAPRDELIRKGDNAHERAERAWRMRDLWNGVLRGLLAIAAVAFVGGVALPLIHISTGGHFVPEDVVVPSVHSLSGETPSRAHGIEKPDSRGASRARSPLSHSE